MVRIQIVSDTHLEFRGDNFKKLIKPSAPILCLLGDICACGTDPDFEIYMKFMRFLSPLFTHIIHVPGNHEYYTVGNRSVSTKDTVQGVDAKIRRFVKTLPNVYFLNNDTIRLKIDGKVYAFVGSALWTMVSPENRKLIGSRMNDYSCIYMNNPRPKGLTEADAAKWPAVRRYTVDDMSKIHRKSVRYIVRQMADIRTPEVGVLLTHHKPVWDSPTKDELTQAYESDLKDVIIREPFKVAAHGHTHVKYDKVINNVRVVSNPKGYISQRTKFDETFTVTL